jgi:hypothetical protein
MCSVRFIQWFLTKNIKEITGDLKFRLEWAGFRFTQCSVSSGFTVFTIYSNKNNYMIIFLIFLFFNVNFFTALLLSVVGKGEYTLWWF